MPRALSPERREPRVLRLAFIGFGNVGRAFAERLSGPYARVLRAHGARALVTGIFTARHGLAIDARGLSMARVRSLLAAGRSLDALRRGPACGSALEFIARVPADVLVEISPLVPSSGEPAVSHVRAALRRGLHVVTANKGPVAFARRALVNLARRRQRLFLHEGAVMDGMPVFNVVERCLPGARILGFRGLLNSTTTRILSRMEQGVTFDAALGEAQAAGVAEADPRHDLEGWDAAVKACALANALMGADVRPAQVERRGILGVTPADVRAARAAGGRLRLIARGTRQARAVRVQVRPEVVASDDVLVSAGADGVVVLQTDLMREVGLWEGAGGIDQTAYALLSDLVAIARARG